MFHALPKWLLIVLIPCLLLIGAMVPLAAFAQSPAGVPSTTAALVLREF